MDAPLQVGGAGAAVSRGPCCQRKRFTGRPPSPQGDGSSTVSGAGLQVLSPPGTPSGRGREGRGRTVRCRQETRPLGAVFAEGRSETETWVCRWRTEVTSPAAPPGGPILADNRVLGLSGTGQCGRLWRFTCLDTLPGWTRTHKKKLEIRRSDTVTSIASKGAVAQNGFIE